MYLITIIYNFLIIVFRGEFNGKCQNIIFQCLLNWKTTYTFYDRKKNSFYLNIPCCITPFMLLFIITKFKIPNSISYPNFKKYIK